MESYSGQMEVTKILINGSYILEILNIVQESFGLIQDQEHLFIIPHY